MLQISTCIYPKWKIDPTKYSWKFPRTSQDHRVSKGKLDGGAPWAAREDDGCRIGKKENADDKVVPTYIKHLKHSKCFMLFTCRWQNSSNEKPNISTQEDVFDDESFEQVTSENEPSEEDGDENGDLKEESEDKGSNVKATAARKEGCVKCKFKKGG